MDYLYSELNASLVPEDDSAIMWKSYAVLPTAAEAYYMQVAVVKVDGADNVYLCIKGNAGYEWKLVVSGSGSIPQITTPTITLEGNLLSWSGVEGAISYTVYNGNTVLASDITGSTFNLSTKITEPGTYSIKIKAIGDGIHYIDSNFSNVVTYNVRYKMYWGATFNIPTGIDNTFIEEECPLNLKTVGAIHYFTTKTEGEVRGKHCIYAYPSYYGDLKHIYCNDLTSFDLIDQWTKVVITYNNMSYNMYYANSATKDEHSKYQYLFIL